MQHPEASPLIATQGPLGHDNNMTQPASSPIGMLWLAAAGAVVFGALVGATACVFSFEWVDSLEMIYLLFFGVILAVLDMPVLGNMKLVADARLAIGRYVHLLTRATGKSVVLMFLGCALFSAMWSNLEGACMLTLSAVLSFFVVLVALGSAAIAVVKSANLNKIRQHFCKDAEAVGHDALSHTYERHARIQPQLGMTPQEFNQMAIEARGVAFEACDLRLVFNALSGSPRRDAMTLTDLHAWVKGSMVFL